MRKIWLLGLMLTSFGIPLLFILRSSPLPVPTAPKTLTYEQRNLPHSIVHILRIPANSRFLVTPALSTKVNTIEEFTQQHPAKAIFNAGFFDPANQKSTSYIFLQGKLVADPKNNERLINNPNLKPYLNKIFNRTEFRRYLCGQTIRCDIAPRSKSVPASCQLVDAIGGGPQLLPELTSVPEGFVDHTNGRDALGSNQANARTAVGITDDGSVILLMVSQKSSTPNKSGISLPALAGLMKTLGIQKAMNLDGGSSSSLYYNGKTFYGKVDSAGNAIKRPVKSVLLVQENSP
ncbi:MAG: phosphodiester glycosidase family protein [Goleter apudmare HA4340-LM2]|nr:phosphodiester glycosidase family protein [Goleter apudmare HA4340-LM2]